MAEGKVLIIIFNLLFPVLVNPDPTETPEIGSGSFDIQDFDAIPTIYEDLEDPEISYDLREEALEKLQQIFGIQEPSDRSKSKKIPPQFMMELYKTIADPSGVTRGKNPYDAKIVRSFIERDTSKSGYYLFNISGLEINESVLEAELHLYRRRTPLKSMHPTVLSSPYYLIRVYQVLDESQLDIPDLHRLLNVHYVGAHASGWQVFNVKQAVLSWISGKKNLGLLVTASNLFGNDAVVDFSRRKDNENDSKQPILVLFNDDGKERRDNENFLNNYKKYGNKEYEEEEEEEDRSNYNYNNEAEEFLNQRRKRESFKNEEINILIKRKKKKFNNKHLNSMDIYERSIIRDKIFNDGNNNDNNNHRYRHKRSMEQIMTSINSTECSRHELYVDFDEIGWSNFIIAPKGYSAYHCKGKCDFPLSQGQHPTNHATVQSIVNLLRKDVGEPCCVPNKLLSSSLLYFDESDNVVLKLYEDMIADRCGCH